MARELSCEDKSRNNNNNNTMVSSGGLCYSEASPTSNNNQPLQTQFTTPQIQSDLFHDHHHHHNQPEIFNLTTGMDMIGFSKTTNTNTSTASSMWKGFDKPFSISESTTSHDHHQNLMIVGPDQQNQPWQLESNNNNNNNMVRPFMAVDESSSLIFPCEGNERPSQGLSLTLSSNNPSTIGLQTFEFRHATTTSQNNQMMMMSLLQQQHGQFQLRSSKFLSPAQELLNEFCSLGAKQTTDSSHKQKSHKTKLQWELDQDNHVNDNNNNNGASSSKKQSLYSLEFMELHKRKTKLLSMLEEVERRYKKYCEQMRAVVSSFEAVAGSGAAGVYSALASKAMSRHFRSLKDGIVAQIEATRRAMGEKDVAASGAGAVPGTTRGETPRLRVIDQAVRQQRAVQQMTMMESHPWRPQRGLPERSVSVLRAWLFEHFLHPYPSDVDKHILARQTNLSRSQVSNWFINARVRLWKPMVEEMYVEETREAQLEGTNNNNNNNNMAGSLSEAVEILGIVDPTGRAGRPDHDQKPTPDQLVRIDSECLSSVVTNDKNTDASSLMRTGTPKTLAQTHPMQQQFQRHQNFGRFPDHSYNTMELDFSSYAPSALYSGDAAAAGQGFIGGNSSGGGVSLTLGLQQHAGAVSHSHHDHHGVSLAFSPASQGSLFYPRSSSENNHHHHQNTNNIDDQCQVPAVQYSLLDGDQGQNLPYRNLMGAQLLHDLA